MRRRHIASHETAAHVKRLQESFTKWIAAQEYELYVTLNLNTDSSYQRLRSLLKALFARLDRLFLGRNWCAVASDCRTQAVAVVENLDTNAHLHVLMTLPRAAERLAVDEQRQIVTGYWDKLVPSGSCDVQLIHDADPLAGYIGKQLGRPGYFELFIFAREFHSN